MATSIDRECFGYCKETCPAIDSAFSDALSDMCDYVAPINQEAIHRIMESLLDTVKLEGTEKLREAMRVCVSDKQDIESDAQYANERVRELESQVDSLISKISSLEKELESCQS